MNSLLHKAAGIGDRKSLRHLLKMGLSTEEQDERGCTPLMVASTNGHWGIAKELLDHAALIDARDQCGPTALMLASGQGHTDVIRLLVERGAALETRNDQGQTALNYTALVSGNVEGIRTLFDLGADIETIDNSGYTPLLSACQCGHLGALRLLIGRGARLDVKTRTGATALSVGPLMATQVRDMGLSFRLTRIGEILREAGVEEPREC